MKHRGITFEYTWQHSVLGLISVTFYEDGWVETRQRAGKLLNAHYEGEHMSDLKYGDIKATKKEFPPDEPLFLFRGKDRFAPLIIRIYATILKHHGLLNMSEEVELEASNMEHWQIRNEARVRQPD